MWEILDGIVCSAKKMVDASRKLRYWLVALTGYLTSIWVLELVGEGLKGHKPLDLRLYYTAVDVQRFFQVVGGLRLLQDRAGSGLGVSTVHDASVHVVDRAVDASRWVLTPKA